MDSTVANKELVRGLSRLRESSAVLAVFAGTLFLSAFLLFSVQPIFAKMVLPKLGGSPSVWAVSMCFFQAVLLLGYCYAHAVNRWVPGRQAPFLHLGLCIVAAMALPFGLPAGTEPPAGDAYLWLIGVLGVGVGLPFFAVSANAPLLQAWFARSGHPHANDPYFLYGASNLGSLIALMAYPFAVEPILGLASQASVWTAGFIALSVLLAVCGLAMVMAPAAAGRVEESSVEASAAPVAWSSRLVWIGLSFVPSGLLVAFSSFLTTDIASAPFLWVIPLALFLATFILVFRDRPYIPQLWLLIAQPALVGVTLFGLAAAGSKGWLMSTIGGFLAFFVTTMVCHRELYERRPDRRHLTEFYLWMSLGGVLGGVFSAIIAPQIFDALHEFPLLLVLGMACRPGIAEALKDAKEREEVGLLAAAGAIVLVCLMVGIWAGSMSKTTAGQLSLVLIVGGAAFMILTRARPLRQVLFAGLTGMGLVLLPSAQSVGVSERSFFGVHRVTVAPNGEARMLLHGTTLHGIERLKDANGQPVPFPVPATYYHPASPMARGVEVVRTTGNRATGMKVGIVGLGAGSMACHAKPGESWRFFEIDPVVVRIARDPKLFSFLTRCQPDADIVLGDARLTLAKEPPGRLDYLVIDAFSSDAVPVHLLTREAVSLYLDRIAADGLLALHISNRHLDLVGVASAVAASIPGLHAAYVEDHQDANLDVAGSRVMFISRSPDLIEKAMSFKGASEPPKATDQVWTDDYSDILKALWRNYRG